MTNRGRTCHLWYPRVNPISDQLQRASTVPDLCTAQGDSGCPRPRGDPDGTGTWTKSSPAIVDTTPGEVNRALTEALGRQNGRSLERVPAAPWQDRLPIGSGRSSACLANLFQRLAADHRLAFGPHRVSSRIRLRVLHLDEEPLLPWLRLRANECVPAAEFFAF